ncbi:MAG: FAD-binding protein [Bacteroidetes bacterium]|nr:FAD-binding protein [Bacteroidota bacterium]
MAVQTATVNKQIVDQLREIVGASEVLTAEEDLAMYAYDATLPEARPDVVVFPRTAQQVSDIMKLASAHKIPVIPRGAGTNLSGGTIALKGGITIALARMQRIIEIDTNNLTATVEPGLVNAEFQAALAPLKLFYPPDPASMNVCTMGGNVAENSGGPKCLKYGVTRDYVLGLEVVLANGDVINTGGRVMKNVTGYDLTRLFVGSEGTLGIITKITVRLLPAVEAKRTMLAIFNDVVDAGSTVSAIIAAGIIPTTLELMDNLLINAAEDFAHAGLPRDADAVLLIEVDGYNECLDRQVEAIQEICDANHAREVRLATTAEEVDKLWVARRTVIGAVARIRPTYDLQDVTVPRSELPKAIKAMQEISKKYNIPIGVLAHAGDGNFHPLMMFDQRDPDELERVEHARKEIFERALELSGTLSGEHGIGNAKRDYLPYEYSPAMMRVTKGIKQFFDPDNILNPNKVVVV